MTAKDALNVLIEVSNAVQLNMKDNTVLREAIEVLKKELNNEKSKETK